jgi:anti-sigma factor RsiW
MGFRKRDNPLNAERLQEQLAAYLDGELDEFERQQVEQRLGHDEALRRRMLDLERSWELLDFLPRDEADERFAATTLSMIALRTAEAERASDSWVRRMPKVWPLAAAATLGFALAGGPLYMARRAALRDVPVVENIDLYRYADSLEFLRQLDEAGLFPEDVDDAL